MEPVQGDSSQKIDCLWFRGIPVSTQKSVHTVLSNMQTSRQRTWPVHVMYNTAWFDHFY